MLCMVGDRGASVSRATDVIDRVLAADLLVREMVVLPGGVADAAITREGARLPRTLSVEHRSIFERWNGVNLDVLRIYGCEGTSEAAIGRLAHRQVGVVNQVRGAIAFASDPAGFVYVEGDDGCVYSIDSDGGAVERLASSIGDFLERVVFGPDAGQFYGDDWLRELQDAGLV